MVLDINNTTAIYDYHVIYLQMQRLYDKIQSLNTIKANRAMFENFKDKAEERYNNALYEIKRQVETEVEQLNINLTSLGLETITIKY